LSTATHTHFPHATHNTNLNSCIVHISHTPHTTPTSTLASYTFPTRHTQHQPQLLHRANLAHAGPGGKHVKVSAKPREAIGTETSHSKTHSLFLLLPFQFALPNAFCTAQLWTFNFCCCLSHADTAICRWGQIAGWCSRRRLATHQSRSPSQGDTLASQRMEVDFASCSSHGLFDGATASKCYAQPDKLAVCLYGRSHSVPALGSDVMNASSSLCRGSLNQTRSLAFLTCECPARC
jgi:hypothetical protein